MECAGGGEGCCSLRGCQVATTPLQLYGPIAIWLNWCCQRPRVLLAALGWGLKSGTQGSLWHWRNKWVMSLAGMMVLALATCFCSWRLFGVYTMNPLVPKWGSTFGGWGRFVSHSFQHCNNSSVNCQFFSSTYILVVVMFSIIILVFLLTCWFSCKGIFKLPSILSRFRIMCISKPWEYKLQLKGMMVNFTSIPQMDLAVLDSNEYFHANVNSS